ncbi:pyroglutamyl-peptidase I family protein [Tessaracoccus antarcticus]|uniref:Pyrrolidone-carboxylate peptidase n=1 Tax=Tessaracoccus antarcticus TaxID=2479848 RepID=A0A3M0FZY8_9ACTN|nr:pyroglutamyl-peptidase I [Tessaracoccus antarcticus]RMB58260.1 pyroglutamyl-peptidase I [Tessaracoccus antarcticus]
MRVLVTGFEPFGGDALNASGAVVERLATSWHGDGVVLCTAILPVEFDGAPVALAAAIAAARPDAVIALGEAGGRTEVTPERWAGPTALGRIPDNAGRAPRGEPLDAEPGPLGSRLDVDAMVAAILSVGVASRASPDAGSFVCNATFRALLRDHAVAGGFIHVPAVRNDGVALVGAETDEVVGEQPTPSMGLDDLVRAVEAVIRLLAAH